MKETLREPCPRPPTHDSQVAAAKPALTTSRPSIGLRRGVYNVNDKRRRKQNLRDAYNESLDFATTSPSDLPLAGGIDAAVAEMCTWLDENKKESWSSTSLPLEVVSETKELPIPITDTQRPQSWGFIRGGLLAPSSPATTECPSLTSGQTVSSRNSSTRSTKSFRWSGNEFQHLSVVSDHDEMPDHLGISGPKKSDGYSDPVVTALRKDIHQLFSRPTPPKEVPIQPSKEPSKVEADEIAELTATSRCLSLTSSTESRYSDESEWTEDVAHSPESDTDAMHVGPFLSPIKRQLVDDIMSEFHRLFENVLTGEHSDNYRACHGGGRGGGHGNANFSGWSSERTSSSPTNNSRKRGLSGGGTPPNDDSNGDDSHKRQRPNASTSAGIEQPEKRFACPYYKRNPGRHLTFTSCRDPGFTTVARLKEHLYRRHLLPLQCNRCCSMFENDNLLREHQRDPRGCEVKDQIPPEGFDKEQERKLKSKKRSQNAQSEEDKWVAVYKILFPDDVDAMIPVPYIDYQAPGGPASGESSKVAEFEAFSRLELPRLVRRTLEAVVEEEAQPLEERLKDRLVDIVQECQTQLFSMFHGGREPAIATEHGKSPVSRIAHRPAADQLVQMSNPASLQYSDPPYNTVDLPLNPKESFGHASASSGYQRRNPSWSGSTSGSPDSGYDSTGMVVALPQGASFHQAPMISTSTVNPTAYSGIYQEGNVAYDTSIDPCMWPFANPESTFNSSIDNSLNLIGMDPPPQEQDQAWLHWNT